MICNEERIPASSRCFLLLHELTINLNKLGRREKENDTLVKRMRSSKIDRMMRRGEERKGRRGYLVG